MQKNVLDRQAWTSRDELHNEIVYWIEHTYNRRRRQRGLGRLTPVEYELAFATAHDTDAAGPLTTTINQTHRGPGGPAVR